MTAPLTPERLAEYAALEQAATEGPWEQYTEYGPQFYGYLRGEHLQGVGDLNFGEGEQADADRAFVAAARTAVPELLAEVARLTARVSELEAAPSRAEVLREVADWLVEIGEPAAAYMVRTCDIPRADLPIPGETPAELTVYRASHDSIVFGLYTTAQAARDHCETVLRREVGSTMLLGWVPDDGSELAAEELCTGRDLWCTGYVVTPLTALAAYDAEADE